LSCWAIVAINTRPRRKLRLRAALDAAGRDALASHMLARVLAAAQGARSVAQVLIVSPGQDGLPAGHTVVYDAGVGLNPAFHMARDQARAARVRELVLLPADLPQLDATDVEALIDAGRRSRIAIAPDRSGTGTNGLYVPGHLDFTCRFGAHSRAGHEAEARRLGIEPAIVARPGLAMDLDTPDDLRMLQLRMRVQVALAPCPAERA
jgi:2-phospho-L-lactate guanylyltransferase